MEQTPLAAGRTTLMDLIKIVLEDQQLKPDEKRNLIDELRKNNPGTSDRWTYRYAILTLGGAVLLAIFALWYLGAHQVSAIPEGLISIGSAAVGGVSWHQQSSKHVPPRQRFPGQ